MRSLVHPRMLDRLAPAFFPSRLSIEVNTPIRSSSGAMVASWGPLAGHGNIPCAVAPAGGNERRGTELTTAESTHVAMLNGRFPGVLATHRAVIAGIAYDITTVDNDSQAVVTRLGLRLVSPSSGQ